jgi:mono/diheme cytochrome c family protein
MPSDRMPIPLSAHARVAALLATVLLLGAPFARTVGAQNPVPAPLDPAAEAVKQMELGEQWFRAACYECHATGALANADFRLKWAGRSAYELFESIRSTMPESDPGSLTQGTYVAVVSYLMKMNGMPVGTSALPADSAGLSIVKLTFAPAASTLRR